MAPSKPFGKLPANAASDIHEYELHVPDEDIKQMQELLKFSPVAGPIYENSLPNGDNHLGIRRDWLIEAKRVWETEFDWRATENRVNSFPNFQVPIRDKIGTFNVHFAALFSNKPDAVPVVLLHGWPGSFLEFLPMLELFRQKYTPETLPFHLVIPSLPGFTLSGIPKLSNDISQVDVARIVDSLMKQIGFGTGYVAQGGDVGSRVSRIIAVDHEACKAIHLNFCAMTRPASATDDSKLSSIEQDGLKRLESWKATETAYALEHATKPSTIGFALSSSPLALLSWIGEKFLAWVDSPLPLNTILESVSLYWLTRSAHSSLWSYRHSYGPNPLPHDDPRYHIKIPLGYSYFAKELIPIPIDWVATTGNLVWRKCHERGGHFAALEQPKEFMEDLETFVGQVWKS
ncbi:uncharacterized protein PV06_00334 [Exophiala oligosperma]|uniref:Epoxide hydrolase N-terminal domain-containing protein n=1 Tax=Exophiala oligosperma TaxID=215243 RepID=A0A0D2B5W4_9EURO|nr:uncharacterized protein PV06_00334 [Exophiala oligosperma]KIW47661.1 hypothetical protein PV06_00334 [Exophiala oligosperma]